MLRILRLALPAALAFGSAVAAHADNFPSKPLKIVVIVAPGGSADAMARLVAENLGPRLGQPVVVENRPGASNTIAADLAAHAPPDGSTLLLATNTGQAVAPHLLKLKYDPLKDLQPIGLVAVMPNVLIVPTDAPPITIPWRVFSASSPCPAIPRPPVRRGG